MATTPNLQLVELESNQLNAENTVNDALITLDTLVLLTVLDMSLTTPPGSPTNGDRYIPLATATGDWAGYENDIAYYYNGWNFISPVVGWTVYDDDTGKYKIWDGTNWRATSLNLSSEKVASYQAVLADMGGVIVCNHSAGITITLDDAITTAGSYVDIVNRGTALVTVAVEGSDSLESLGGNTDISIKGAARAIRIASGVWFLEGDLE